MDPQLLLLATTAASVGFVHTAVGVDHTLPFVVLGRARAWSLSKTLAVTGLCGVGHVGSSVAIAGVALWLGQSALQLAALDRWRGDIAAWALIVFGVAYAGAGWLGRARRHQHYHVHKDGVFHTHEHAAGEVSLLHYHPHTDPRRSAPFRATPALRRSEALSTSRLAAALFIVFVTGPCEALVPLLFASGVQGNSVHVGTTVFSFSLATVATMLSLVTIGFLGLRPTWLSRVEGLLHVSTGFAIALSGAGVRFLGL